MDAAGPLRIHSLASALLALVLGAAWVKVAHAQTPAARVLVTSSIDDTKLARLAGNTRREATAANDRGRVADTLALPHMQLLLKRPAEREQALERYIAQLHDRTSPYFHRWLTPAEFGQRFGVSAQDLAAVTAWLRQRGFSVNTVYPSTLVIDFSGTAGDVRNVFHTEIHALSVRGAQHIANMSDPQIPAALAPVVASIVSLHDFRPHAMHRPRAAYTVSTTAQLVVPADLATIYNLNPVFSGGNTGQGQTIVVIEDTNVFNTADWTQFRSTFGLAGFAGTFTQLHPAPASGPNNCSDPGVVPGNDGEASLDAEWALAAAPGAAIELASCADTTTFGGLIALQNLLSQAAPPAIVSISYGECEAFNGASANAAYIGAYQQAVTAGVSVFVSSGDEGAASCDANQADAAHAIGVSGFASTPYNVAVGGTDFGDAYAGTTTTYWNSTNTATFGSARSYIPEIPWNDSCASVLIASAFGFATTYGSSGFCNSSTGHGFLSTASGSGGPSGCASGAPTTAGVVSGTCAGTPKPAWQTGVPGIPSDGVRDLPDVSLFAANGVWGHYYVYCWSDTAVVGGAPCTSAPNTWSGAGGTSFSAPILAGIQALVNHSTGARQGNPNYVYYTLAASQSASGLACNSSSGNAVASGCVFYDVTLGDMDVNCLTSITTTDCYRPSGTNGVLSTTNTAYAKAYGATAGWDFATGIGSLNAANLIKYWTSSDLSVTGSGTVTGGGLLSYGLSVGDRGPQGATGVVVTTVLPAGMTLVTASSSPGCTQTGQTVKCTIGTLAVGATAALTIVIQPGGQQSVNLTFAATSNNADLNPADGVRMIALNVPGEQNSGDAPLPLWASVALALMLWAIATRRSTASARPGADTEIDLRRVRL